MRKKIVQKQSIFFRNQLKVHGITFWSIQSYKVLTKEGLLVMLICGENFLDETFPFDLKSTGKWEEKHRENTWKTQKKTLIN